MFSGNLLLPRLMAILAQDLRLFAFVTLPYRQVCLRSFNISKINCFSLECFTHFFVSGDRRTNYSFGQWCFISSARLGFYF